ncbi:MAG: hypothetical protein J0M18_13195 [Ignavibacteria bacterium]|nr:hypothetical protein [Ignavibacteria bacterium]
MYTIKNILITLLLNGFNLDKVERFSNENIICHVSKFDKLGAQIKYSLFFLKTKISETVIQKFLRSSKALNTYPLLISDKEINYKECNELNYKAFFNIWGGILNTGLILVPNLSNILTELGLNKLPKGLNGKPDNLFELYCKECLQYCIDSPTIRYGKERSYESLPDGVILGKNKMVILYDTKAYSNGFGVSADDITRFTKYVNEYNEKYEQYFGKVFTFLVLTTTFKDSDKSLEGRSNELYSNCQTKISYLSSKNLATITKLIKENSNYRKSILWNKIFTELIIKPSNIQSQLLKISKDKIL